MGLSSICTVGDCSNPHWARGYCGKHYQRFRTTGSVEKTRANHSLDFLNANAGHTGKDCLIWPFSLATGGYGKVKINGKSLPAHREMCRMAHGEPPNATDHAAHSCGRGAEGCVNPRHLSWKSPADNNFDKVVHGVTARGEEHCRAKLTEAEVLAIFRDGRNQKDTAKAFGVSKATVCFIRDGRNWGWLTGKRPDYRIGKQSTWV